MTLSKKIFAADQIQGDRNYQEDSLDSTHLESDDGSSSGLLFVLADGMGGHAGGQQAGELAVKTFIESFTRVDGDIKDCMRTALEEADAAIAGDKEKNPMLSEMGCTLVAVWVVNGEVHWASVGDSPLWLIRNGELTRLNEDHSMRPLLEGLVELGRMTPEELETDKRSNVLRSALKGDELALVDVSSMKDSLQPGDCLISASDGLETLSDAMIRDIIVENMSHGAEVVVDKLLTAIEAEKKPGQDNTSVMVFLHEPDAAGSVAVPPKATAAAAGGSTASKSNETATAPPLQPAPRKRGAWQLLQGMALGLLVVAVLGLGAHFLVFNGDGPDVAGPGQTGDQNGNKDPEGPGEHSGQTAIPDTSTGTETVPRPERKLPTGDIDPDTDKERQLPADTSMEDKSTSSGQTAERAVEQSEPEAKPVTEAAEELEEQVVDDVPPVVPTLKKDDTGATSGPASPGVKQQDSPPVSGEASEAPQVNAGGDRPLDSAPQAGDADSAPQPAERVTDDTAATPDNDAPASDQVSGKTAPSEGNGAKAEQAPAANSQPGRAPSGYTPVRPPAGPYGYGWQPR